MYKYISMLLGICVLSVGSLYLWERHKNSEKETELNNQLAKLENMVQETQTAYSSLGVQITNLATKNKELQKIIDGRGEEIVALNEVILQWKDKYFKILNAYQSIVDGNGNPVPPDPTCDECLKNKRFKVEFSQTQDYISISGFTLTNPPVAELTLKWIKDLTLNLVLTKSKKDSFRVYIESNDANVVPIVMNLKVDPSVFAQAWYEKVSLGTSVSVGDGVGGILRGGYDVTNKFNIGPNFMFYYDGKQQRTLYGVSVEFYPFRR